MCERCQDTMNLHGVQNTKTNEVIELDANMSPGRIADTYRYPEWAYWGADCPCRGRMIAKRQIEAAYLSIPKDVQGKTLADFDNLPHAQFALSFATALAHGEAVLWEDDTKVSMILMGDTGTGKSSLAFAVYKARSECGVRCMWINYMELINHVRETYVDGYAGPNVAAILSGITHAPFLVIDDLGSETRTTTMAEDAIEAVRQIVDYRFNQQMPTIITTNLSGTDKLSTQFGGRVASRIMGMCHVIEMRGVDMRTGIDPRRPKVVKGGRQ